MTPMAVLLSACALIGIRDPGEFWSLPDSARDLWLEHARNLFTGAYERRRKPKGGGQSAADAIAAERAFLAAQQGGRRNGTR